MLKMNKILSINTGSTFETKSKPSLAVLYGKPDYMSTSFQTNQLVQSLKYWFEPLPIKVKSVARISWRYHLNRILTNYVKPLMIQPKTDYLFYANDGMVDLTHWYGKKLLYWYDTPWDWSIQPPSIWQWVQWLRYRNVMVADYVFAVSHIQVKLARCLRPGREETVAYLPVGVNCRVFDPAYVNPERMRQQFQLPKKTIIGYLGYLGTFKGRFAGEPLVEIAPKLLAQQNVHFLIVGFGPALVRFKQRVKELGLINHFTFTGFVPDDLLPNLIAAMDICVDTLEEGFHSEARSETKLKQYMAMGKACVATAIGENCVDLDFGRCGILVKPSNNDLLKGIIKLCKHPWLRDKLGYAARKRAEELYDWPKLAARLVTFIGIKS